MRLPAVSTKTPPIATLRLPRRRRVRDPGTAAAAPALAGACRWRDADGPGRTRRRDVRSRARPPASPDGRRGRPAARGARIPHGQGVGEMNLFTDAQRSATVMAVRDSVLVRLERAAFRQLLSHPRPRHGASRAAADPHRHGPRAGRRRRAPAGAPGHPPDDAGVRRRGRPGGWRRHRRRDGLRRRIRPALGQHPREPAQGLPAQFPPATSTGCRSCRSAKVSA